MKNVIIELDAKSIMDSIHVSKVDLSEFGTIIYSCKSLLQHEPSFSVCFARQQANLVAHQVARVSHLYASPIVLSYPPNCVVSHLYK